MFERLTAADGHEFDGWIEPATGEARAGLVILQEIFGVTDHLKDIARRYAALGYEVAVPALFDRHERGAVLGYSEGQTGRDLMLQAKLDETMLDIDATVGALATRCGKVGVIGFCWGGGLALRAAQVLDVAAAVSFYGTRLDSYLDQPLKVPVLGHFGARDPHVPPEMLKDAQDYLPEFHVELYEAGHAFANNDRESYVPAAAELAHERTKAFLALHLG